MQIIVHLFQIKWRINFAPFFACQKCMKLTQDNSILPPPPPPRSADVCNWNVFGPTLVRPYLVQLWCTSRWGLSLSRRYWDQSWWGTRGRPTERWRRWSPLLPASPPCWPRYRSPPWPHRIHPSAKKKCKIHWASKETYHFFKATHIKIQSIKMNHNWA